MTGTDSSDWLGLSGRVCVVTGGGGGIGRAVVVSLAQAGARVAAIDLDERGLEIIQAELRKLGSACVVTRCDTSSVESVTAASATIEKSLGVVESTAPLAGVEDTTCIPAEILAKRTLAFLPDRPRALSRLSAQA